MRKNYPKLGQAVADSAMYGVRLDIRKLNDLMDLDTHILHRYEEDNDGYITTANRSHESITQRGNLRDRPEWLTTIVTMLKVGEHGAWVPRPPPTYIVWFTTDRDNNLLSVESFK